MAFFFDDELRRRRRSRGPSVGWTLLLVAILGATALAWIPSPYVLQQPGSTFDTLGSVTIDDDEIDLIDIPEETIYPTEGSLRLLTVGVVGSRRTPIPWLDVLKAWFDPSKAAIPVESVYPEGQTVEQSNEVNHLLMTESQKAATAAALVQLGHDVPTVLTVHDIVADSPAEGQVQKGDQIVSVNGEALPDAGALQDAVADSELSAIELGLVRDGQNLSVTLIPVEGLASRPIVGVTVQTSYDFPFEVDIQLRKVGGPSAGMMFALGIIDKLTPGPLTGGEEIAGTGTITADGVVGPIGGIRQKLYGAHEAGSQWFLAPAQNCDEVVGHVPDGLTVFAVSTLNEAMDVVEAIGKGDTSRLQGCGSA